MSQTDPAEREPTLLGHPRGLFVLFFAELWERFCYYGMRALLVFHVSAQFQKTQEEASEGFGAFTALIYALGIFGGHIADRILGYRRTIVLGGAMIALGEFMLMIPREKAFLMGLAAMIVGNGLFKPNISTLVGKLYRQGDPRRDSGFTIFYMGINIGAFLAPIFCARISRWMSDDPSVPEYKYGFMLAGIGMLLGLVVFGAGSRLLHGQGLPPKGREGFRSFFAVAAGCVVATPLIYLLLSKDDLVGRVLLALGAGIALYLLYVGLRSDRVQLHRIIALLILLVCNIAFWASFEQAGNALNFFARDHIRHLHLSVSDWEWTMVPEDFQSVNAIAIVLLGPVFAALWTKLDRKDKNPSIPAKFGLGLIQVGLGFGLLMLAFPTASAAGQIPWFWLVGLYVIHTTGELCISPVGLSMVTKLAPERMTGMVMGAWFISIALANFAAGQFSKIAGSFKEGAGATTDPLAPYVAAFTPILYMSVGIGLALLITSKLVNKLMHGVK